MNLFNGDKINNYCYEEGAAAYRVYEATGIKENNPYEKNTIEWYSWNKGWNEA